MDLSSSTLKNRAKQSLSGNYWVAFAACLIISLIPSVIGGAGVGKSVSAIQPTVEQILSGNTDALLNIDLNFSSPMSFSSLAVFLLMAPLEIGLAKFFLDVADRRGGDLGTLFGEFRHYGNTLLLSVLTGLFTTLWSLLFIIPGIIAALGYAMAPYIIAEHPEIKASEAIKISKDMMRGNKGKLFLLDLSFIGWGILCVFTFGIGFLFLEPYMKATKAEFFNEVSGNNYERSLGAPGAAPYTVDANAPDSGL